MTSAPTLRRSASRCARAAASSSSACARPVSDSSAPRACAPARRPARPRPACGHGCGRAAVRPGLVDQQVPVRVRRDLRQVGHDHHLVPGGQAGQPTADLDRRPAAHPGVDLVEDHGRHRVRAGQRHLEGEHHARQLTARRTLVQRLRRGPGMGDKPQLDLVDTVRARREGRVADEAGRREHPGPLYGV